MRARRAPILFPPLPSVMHVELEVPGGEYCEDTKGSCRFLSGCGRTCALFDITLEVSRTAPRKCPDCIRGTHNIRTVVQR